MIIVTSDNGAVTDFRPDLPMYGTGMNFGHKPCDSLRGQKCDIYEGGHRVPFVARWPGRIKAGCTSDEIICLTDLMATCAAIVGVNLPENTGEDSYNILPALLDQDVDRPIREAVVHHSGYGMFSIRQGPWKLILGRGSGGFTEPGGFEPKAGEPKGQLYNLKQDLCETNNLWAEHPEIVEHLTKLLEKYKRQGHSRNGV